MEASGVASFKVVSQHLPRKSQVGGGGIEITVSVKVVSEAFQTTFLANRRQKLYQVRRVARY